MKFGDAGVLAAVEEDAGGGESRPRLSEHRHD